MAFVSWRRAIISTRSGLRSAALAITQYWDVPAARPAQGMDDQEFIRELPPRLEETVELRLMSDVPWACS